MIFKKKTEKAPKDVPDKMNWEYDLVLQERRSRQLAWRVAAFTGALAFLALIALVVVLPLKQVVPYIVKVDDVTGDASIIQSAASYVQSTDINDKHWLKRYVIAHDRYDYYLLQTDFDLVKNLSADNTFRAYAAQFADPVKIQDEYKDKVTIGVEILSITITRKGYATVRYQVSRKSSLRSDVVVEKRIATISYSYDVKRTGTTTEMIDNPLGFTVGAFQTEVEFKTSITTENKS
jgi:type IV secretion system protein VirB8